MAENSSIEWTDTTWQVTTGCEEVSPGCGHCYARTMAKRLRAMALADIAAGKDPGAKRHYINAVDERGKWTGKVVPRPDALNEPLRWKKPRRVFVNSMSDLFHPDVPFAFIDQVFAVMALTPQHTYQVLTKRPERMAEYLTRSDAHNQIELGAEELGLGMGDPALGGKYRFRSLPFQNVWLGTSVENQETCSRLDYLTKCPAAVRFVSFEPLLESVDPGFRNWADDPKYRIHWAIMGGESGPGARPCNADWIRFLIDDCRHADVACFVKQLGANAYDETNRPAADVLFPNGVPDGVVCEGFVQRRHDLALADRKGGDMAEWPADLRVRQFPTKATSK